MARAKKNGTYLNICIESPIYEKLEALWYNIFVNSHLTLKEGVQ